MRHLALLLLLAGCDPAAPQLVEVVPPGDTREPLGPYEVTAVVRGAADRVEVTWTTGDETERTTRLRDVGGGVWRGGIGAGGVPPGTRVELWVTARGPGGDTRKPSSGVYAFRVLDRTGACLVDGDCLAPEICDRLIGQCKRRPETCDDDGDCPQDYICPEGGEACRFRPSTCVNDADCGRGLECADGVCVSRPECDEDADCPGGTCIVPPGRCAARDECARDADCPGDRPLCRGGRCRADTCEPACRAGERCELGACVPEAACEGGCPAGERCFVERDLCVECTADGHCGPGRRCDTEGGFTCLDGARGRPCMPCGPGDECGGELRCSRDYAHLCLPRCDGGRGDCPEGSFCDGLVCIPDSFCRFIGCFADADCESGACLAGRCDPPQYCSLDADCAPDRQCRGGRCVPGTRLCGSPADCSPGEVCAGGRCEAGVAGGTCAPCGSPSDCPTLALCADIDGSGPRCVPFCGPAGCERMNVCNAFDAGGLCLPAAGICDEDVPCADQWEPNDSPDQATPLAFDTLIRPQVCPGDTDWFRPAPGRNRRLLVFARSGLRVTYLDARLTIIGGLELGEASAIEDQLPDETDILLVESAGVDTPYELELTGEPVVCRDDNLEDNDGPDQVTFLRAGAQINGVSCPGDGDWFDVRLRPGQVASAVVVPAEPDAGLRWTLYAPDLVVLASGPIGREGRIALPREHQLLALETMAPTAYRLEVRAGEAACLDDDRFEPNNEQIDATQVELGFDSGGLTLCQEAPDWYVFRKPRGRAVLVEVDFSHREGDLDLEVVAEDGRFRESSTTVTDREVVEIPAELPAGLYFARVYLLDAGRSSYRLRVRRP